MAEPSPESEVGDGGNALPYPALASESGLEANSVNVIALNPDTEVALGLAEPEIAWAKRPQIGKLADHALDERVAAADVLGRAAKNSSLAKLLEAIGVGLST